MRRHLTATLVAAMLAGACAAHPTPQVVPELPPIKPGEWEGTRWEYVCLHIGPGWTDLWDDEMLELFNVWGAGGWELFYVGHEAACFKRPRESASSLVMLADHPDPPPLDGP